MAKSPQLLDHRGNPVQRSELVAEVSAAEFGSVRSPVTSYPGDGLNPLRLGAIHVFEEQATPTKTEQTAGDATVHRGALLPCGRANR